MRTLVGLFAVTLAGCSEAPSVPFYGEDEKQADAIELLKSQVEQLQKDVIEARGKADRRIWANLKPNEDGFALIDAAGMPLAFDLEDVTESASGSKIKLKVGNPTAAVITRLHLDLSYGKSTEDGLLTSPILNKTETVTTRLPAGQWTDVTIGLPNMPAKDLGIVRINGAIAESITLSLPAS